MRKSKDIPGDYLNQIIKGIEEGNPYALLQQRVDWLMGGAMDLSTEGIKLLQELVDLFGEENIDNGEQLMDAIDAPYLYLVSQASGPTDRRGRSVPMGFDFTYASMLMQDAWDELAATFDLLGDRLLVSTVLDVVKLCFALQQLIHEIYSVWLRNMQVLSHLKLTDEDQAGRIFDDLRNMLDAGTGYIVPAQSTAGQRA
jgi:hypothetical protein